MHHVKKQKSRLQAAFLLTDIELGNP